MIAPVESRFGVSQDDRGRLHYFHTLFRSEAREDVVHRFESHQDNHLVLMAGRRPVIVEIPVPKQAVDATKRRAAALDKAVKHANEPVVRANERIGVVLSMATDRPKDDDPSRWWKWWFDYNELDSYVEKPVREYMYYDYFSHSYAGSGIRRPTMGSCFAAGTLVWTDCGQKQIETLKIGDLVLAKDTETGELAFKPVVGGTYRKPVPMLKISVGQDGLLSTRGHPFWVSGRGWTMAKELKVGMPLHTATGSVSVAAIEPAEAEPTYNLVVGDFDTYFVGQEKIFVHDVRPAEPTIALVPGLPRRAVAAR
ncbi:MAG: polymorphic toxin-type HINT domain-containing protein [Pirellulales bacterium]